MPRVSRYGDVCGGVGDAVTLNRAVIVARGTCAAFLDPTRLIYQVEQNGVWSMEGYDLATRQRIAVPAGKRGCNALAAGGGRWLAFLAGVGVYDEQGTIWPDAGLAGVGTDGRGAMGLDGTVGWVNNYQAGSGVRLLPRSGGAITLPDAAAGTLSIVNKDIAVWVERGQVRAFGLLQPAEQREPVSAAQALYTGDAWVLLITTNTRVVLREWFTTRGQIIVDGPVGFAAHGVALTPLLVRVVSSRTAGERAEDIKIQDVAPADMRELETRPDPPRPPDPVPVPVPAPHPVPPKPAPTPVPAPPRPAPAPLPRPAPAPQPSKEPQMIAYGKPLADFALGEQIDNGNGTVSVKKPNGKYLCITPDGGVEERDTPGGVWESFKPGKTALIAEREKNGHAVAYVLPRVEA